MRSDPPGRAPGGPDSPGTRKAGLGSHPAERRLARLAGSGQHQDWIPCRPVAETGLEKTLDHETEDGRSCRLKVGLSICMEREALTLKIAQPLCDFQGPDRNRCLSIPNRLMRDSSVVEGIPRIAAAPLEPETRPAVWARASSIWRLSVSRRLSGRGVAAGEAGTPTLPSSGSSTRSTSPSERMAARSMTFWSSRTLPRQEEAGVRGIELFSMLWKRLPNRAE